MKKLTLNRVLSVLLAFVLVLSFVPPVQLFAEEVTTVYLDPVNGADTAAGTETAPVKTLAKAYEKLTAGGTVVFLDTLTWSASGFMPACKGPVTLTSKTGAEGMNISANLRMQADTTFTNMTLTFNNSAMMMVSGEGHDLTIEADVNMVRTTTAQLNITPACRYGSAVTANPTLTVKAGSWNYIYGTHGYGVNGDVNVIVEGGSYQYVSPCYNATVTGNVNITVKGGKADNLYLEPTHADGKITGNLNVTLEGAAEITTVAASKGTVQGSANVTVKEQAKVAAATGYGAGSKLTLNAGTVGAVSGFATTAIDVPAENTLTIDGTATADTLTCAGTLNFTENGSLTAKAVTGKVNCTFTGAPQLNKAIVTAPAGSDIQFPEATGIVGMGGKWMLLDKGNFKGLIVKAESDVTMVFYKDHTREAADKIQPDFTETVDGYTYYYFAGISGYYCYDASRTGDYTIYQRLYISAAERDAGCLEEVVMEKKSTEGWDYRYYYGQVDEYIEKSENDMTEKWHTEVPLESPVFTLEGKPAHQMTTQPELEAFIQDIAKDNPNIYIFSIGKSAKYGLDIPIVFFTKTDLSDCTTLEEVAEKLQASGLHNVGYKAQMHGDEHAAGEGALNVIKQLSKPEYAYLMDKINIYIMPRINPDGAKECQRNLRSQSMLYNFSGSTDPNRHMLSLAAHEARLYLRTVQLFDPIAELDGHERQRSSNIADNQIGASWCYGFSQEMLDLQVDMIYSMFDAMKAVDLSASWYDNRVNTTPGQNTRSYAGQQGRIHLLMETRGIYLGNECYETRTASHTVCALTYLKYCAENADTIAATVAAEQAGLVLRGKTYEESDQITLSGKEVLHPEYNQVTEKANFGNGTIDKNYTHEAYMYEVGRSRVAPTAYVIPKGLPREAEILELMQLQEIAYYELPANTAISLQQYSGTVGADLKTTNLTLSTEQMFAFPTGCYVFRMDQVNSYVLAKLMEADDGSLDLVEQGRIPGNEDGTLPIYRYIKDLNEDEYGIVFTTATAAPTGISATNATSAANDGVISGLEADKLYEYKQGGADAYIQAPAGATQITGLTPGTYYVRYQLAEGSVGMDTACVIGCNAVVYLSASAGSDENAGTTENAALATIEAAYAKLAEILGASGDASTGKIVLLNDYTITSNARVDLPSHGYPVTIQGKTQSVRLIFKPTVMEEAQQQLAFHGDTTLDNLTFRAASTAKYDYIFACGNKLTINANVKTTSARSSTYPYLVAGDYKTTVTNTNLTVLGGRWQSAYATGFKASHTGVAKLYVDGTNVTLNSAIRTTYSGTPSGDTEITLKNLAAGTVYLGTYYSGNISGDVTLYLQEGVTGTFYTGARRSGSVNGTVTIVADGVELEEITLKNAPGADNTSGTVNKAVICYATGDAVPVEGFDETHIVTDKKVNLVADLAVDRIAGGGVVELNGYKLTGEGIYNVAAGVKSVSLRPNAAGIYFTGDFTVADELEATFGIALSTQDAAPVAQEGGTSLYTLDETSVLVQNILKPGNADNGKNARTKIYARAYVKLSDGTIIYGTTSAVSLYQVVKAIDAKWDNLSDLQKQGMQQLQAAYPELFASWKLQNVK